MRIDMQINDQQVQDLLRAIERNTGSAGMRLLFTDFGRHGVESVRQTIRAGGRPEPWPPLKLTSTMSWALKRKTWRKGKSKLLTKRGQAVAKGRKPLIDTGMLLTSIHEKVLPDGVAIGTNRKGAAIQHFGGPSHTVIVRPVRKKALFWPILDHPVARSIIPAHSIPARPFLMLQDEDWKYLIGNAGRLLLTGRL